MINQECDVQKTKHLPQSTTTSVAIAGSDQQMLRDIKDNLSHLRRDKTSLLPTPSGLPIPCSTASRQPTATTCLSSATKCRPMQIKSNLNSIAAIQQIAGLGPTTVTNGVLACATYTGASDGRVPNAVKSATHGYKERALAEIRNSLKPFANNDQSVLSSASSTTSESSGFSQITDSVGFDPNGLNKDHRNSLQLLLSMGYSEDSALQLLKSTPSKNDDFSSKSDLSQKSNKNQKIDLSNGLTRPRHTGLSKLNVKYLQKSTPTDSGWEGSQSRGASSTTESSTASMRSESPGICITGLQHQLLPDPPRLLNGPNFEGNSNLPHAHSQWNKQQINYSSNDLPPPLPPPRGMTSPPLTSSKGITSSFPLPISQSDSYSHYNNNPLTTNQYQQILKRRSPVLHNSQRPQPLSYNSSSSSTPQRGTSPVSLGRPIGQQQLVQKLQALNMYSSGTSSISSKTDLPPPYPASSSHSPASLSSLYSSPPPSSSSGRQSPTPTVSSSEYSVLPFQRRTPPPAYPSSSSSSSGSTHGCHPSPSSSNVNAASATVITTVIPRPSPLQAWTARQAKSQSPVIMQSVKSTHVQKPVLQTAVAPTSPPVCTTPPSFPVYSQQTNNSNTVLENNQTLLNEASQLNIYLSGQNHSSNSPVYLSTVQSIGNQQHLVLNTQMSDQASFLTTSSNNGNSSVIYSSSNLPTYQCHEYSIHGNDTVSTSSQPPPPYSVSVQNHSVKPDNVNGLKQIKQNQTIARHESTVKTTVAQIQQQVPVTVPTTDPPSYACGVAALAFQKAASVMNSNSNYNSNISAQTSSMFAQSVNNIPVSSASHLMRTVEMHVASVPSTSYSNIRNGNINDHQIDNKYFSNQQPPPLPRKPSPITADSAKSKSRPESPICHPINECPVTSSATQVHSTQEEKKASLPPLSQKKTMHHSPIPPRRVLSKEMEEERRETKIRNFSPTAFKFFMEQHIENVLKSYHQRLHRRQQLEMEMVKVGLSEEAQCQMRLMLHQKESNYIRLKRAKMNKSMFSKLKTIGVGAFGEVALVKKLDTEQLYAMKTLRKEDVFKRNQAAHVKAERDILAEADNEWVVKLYYSFQDKDNLYFVMDYIPGGDLMSLLIRFGVFGEHLAKFYITELVLAIESVHKMGFIHRDIKPDNILIDRDGHIKLTDFGLCTGFRWTHNSKYYQRNGEHNRQDSMDHDDSWNNECHCTAMKPLERRRLTEHQRCLAHSLVGTPNYIAPEVLLRTGYTQLCDWWSVGVILFEMLVGRPPFLASSPAETQRKIIHWKTSLTIPESDNVSSLAADIIIKLCRDPEERLGKNGAGEIKTHPFFKDMNFENLRQQKVPYCPQISYPTDTSNFDPVDPDKLRNDLTNEGVNEDSIANGRNPEHAFFEFTFRRFFDDGGQPYPIKISLDEAASKDVLPCIDNHRNKSTGTFADDKTSAYSDSGQTAGVYV